MFKDIFFLTAQKILPQAYLSRLVGRIANCENTIIKNKLISLMVSHFDIDLEDAVIQDPKSYASVNQLFTRHLKPESRPIDQNSKSIISPTDGKITQMGKITNEGFIQAKNKYFSLRQLTANTSKENYSDFVVIYLSPSDYHRVHMLMDGKLTRMTYIPGKLFSVNNLTVENINGIFVKNERLICYFDTEIGEIAVIFIGAMLVAGIQTTWHKLVAPNYYNKITHFSYGDQNLYFKKGQEIGFFNFGSTVIALFPSKTINWKKDVKSQIKMGKAIAIYN